MRTVLAMILAMTTLPACGLFFGEKSTHNSVQPDASISHDVSLDAHDPTPPDANVDDGGGCHTDDANGNDGGWYPDASVNDAAWPVDAGVVDVASDAAI